MKEVSKLPLTKENLNKLKTLIMNEAPPKFRPKHNKKKKTPPIKQFKIMIEEKKQEDKF